MPTYLLGLGSNLEPDNNLPKAARLLQHMFDVLDVSPMVDTTPVGDTFNYPFKNQLVIIRTELDDQALKQQLLALEEHMGREPKTPSRQYRDRPIDIDILACGIDERQCLKEELEESYYASVQRAWLTAC